MITFFKSSQISLPYKLIYVNSEGKFLDRGSERGLADHSPAKNAPDHGGLRRFSNPESTLGPPHRLLSGFRNP
jgi:hypothetical protein